MAAIQPQTTLDTPSGQVPELRLPAHRRAFSDHLRLGLACPLNWGEGRRLVARFLARRPKARLSVYDGDEIELASALQHGRLDVVVAPAGAARRGLLSLPLWSEPLLAVLREGHSLAQANSLDLNALRDEPMLLAGDGSGDRAFRRAVFQAIGGMPAHVVHQDVQRDTLLDLVALGLGITVIPEGFLGAYYPGVTARRLPNEATKITYSLIWPADRESRLVRDLLEGLVGSGQRNDRPRKVACG